jgi:hypothetical protein
MLEFAAGAFVPAFLLAALLTPLARRIALRAGLVAPVRPDRLHREVRPYGGGLALMAVLVVFGVAALLAHPLGFYPGWPRSPLLLPLRWVAVPIGAYALESAYWHLAPLAVGAVLFFIVGLLDDRYAFSAGPKLALQVAAAAIVVFGFGLRAPVAADTAWVSQAVAVLWIVAVVNAYNLLDHADGLAAAVGVVAFVFIALAGARRGPARGRGAGRVSYLQSSAGPAVHGRCRERRRRLPPGRGPPGRGLHPALRDEPVRRLRAAGRAGRAALRHALRDRIAYAARREPLSRRCHEPPGPPDAGAPLEPARHHPRGRGRDGRDRRGLSHDVLLRDQGDRGGVAYR